MARLSALPALRIGLSVTAIAGLLALCACKVETHGGKGDNDSASISFGNMGGSGGETDNQSVSIDVPGFSAKVKVPDLNIGSDDAKIEDMPLFPGTRISGMNVTGSDSDGHVAMRFTAPASPDDVVAYYRTESQRQGWTAVTPAAGEQFAATKTKDDDKPTRLAVQVEKAPGGSAGRFLVSGR